LAPALAALVGVGVARLWHYYRQGERAGWLLPLILIASAIFEVVLVLYFPDWAWWLAPMIVGLALFGGASLWVARIVRRSVIAAIGLSAALLAVLLAPTLWSFTPVLAQGDSGLPFAGPELLSRQGRSPLSANVDTQLLNYLAANRSGEKYLLATNTANQAAPFIIATGEPVMAMGGFSGGDNILTVDQLAQKVAAGEVRYFLISDDRRGDGDLNRWITNQCTPVPASAWGSPPTPTQTGPGGSGPDGGRSQLYDCTS